ncbi:MAG TPA: OmpA family protein [Pyrinomonadaceae bacterium]|jgi:outer membrane protein OmpA-like peptidoglycan-associated protein|nr:OmpA family protein [Pyrinomonadaceae bacterium]
MTLGRIGRYFAPTIVVGLLVVSATLGQGDIDRKTVAITYPLDETVAIKFRGTTLLPRLKGEAKVRRAGRRGTRVELNIDDLPRASELGGIYTTYVLWAISPDGHVDNLGEIKRSGSSFIDSKLDVTTPLQTFALILTAEPHFLMKVPSRMVVMENLPPQRLNGSQIQTADVRYIGNSSDYFRNARVPELADKDYRQTPVSLLGARQAVNLAKYAGASQDATDELQTAEDELQAAEKAWRFNEPLAEIDVLARKATSSGARAEEVAIVRRAARVSREEIKRRDDAVRTAEKTADSLQQEVNNLRAALDKEQRARELAERDAGTANDQLREKRVEVAQLRDELQQLRADSDAAKIKLARLEGEKQAETARADAERRVLERRNAEAALKEALGKYGNLKETASGFRLVLPESIWNTTRTASLAASASAKLEPLAALLANNPDYQILIEAYTDNKGDEVSLQQLTQERARVLSDRFQTAGVDPTKIQANGMGASNPIAPNTTLANRAKNRRVEITFTSPLPRSTAAN